MKSVKKICFTAMGIALFVVLSLCLQVPVFENYYLCLGYISMAACCYFLGPLSGMAVGSIGVMLYCLLTGGLRGMPGWALGNMVMGFMLGIICLLTRKIKNRFIKLLLISITIILSTAIAILGVKSIVECLLYAQPFLFRVFKNLYAFIADIVILLAAFPVCTAIETRVYKVFPELK